MLLTLDGLINNNNIFTIINFYIVYKKFLQTIKLSSEMKINFISNRLPCV